MNCTIYDSELDSGFVDEKLTIEEAIESFYSLSENDDSFLTLKGNVHLVVQFLWISTNKWLIDIPIQDSFNKNISLQKYCDYDECIDIINSTYEQKIIYDLYKIPIMETNLDNILNSLKPIKLYKINLMNNITIEQ